MCVGGRDVIKAETLNFKSNFCVEILFSHFLLFLNPYSWNGGDPRGWELGEGEVRECWADLIFLTSDLQ